MQEQWPGVTQCPPFAHPVGGKQIAAERLMYMQFIFIAGKLNWLYIGSLFIGSGTFCSLCKFNNLFYEAIYIYCLATLSALCILWPIEV